MHTKFVIISTSFTDASVRHLTSQCPYLCNIMMRATTFRIFRAQILCLCLSHEAAKFTGRHTAAFVILYNQLIHHVQKKGATRFSFLTLPNIDRFSNFFHQDVDVDGVYERRPKPLCPHLEITSR